MPEARPLIALLTDFGERDSFVASMKGVILSINSSALLVDLSHQITSHQIQEAGYFLKSCYRYFPAGTIFVAVVDPGVGTERRALLVSAAGCLFVGPDNGLFTEILEQEVGAKVWQIKNPQYRLETAGSTFDGRDVFAPAAAWLSKGVRRLFWADRRRPHSAFGRDSGLARGCADRKDRVCRSIRQSHFQHHRETDPGISSCDGTTCGDSNRNVYHQ